MQFDEMNWAAWKADELATLLFVVQDGQILLIRKKRGLGQGKINGPGGRLEGDETPLQCALRETQEELCIQAHDPVLRARHRFQFVDGYALEVYVYLASGHTGTPTETDEAAPLWFALDEIPYDEMWADDRIWLPMVLAGDNVDGVYLFDKDRMLGHTVETVPDADKAFGKD